MHGKCSYSSINMFRLVMSLKVIENSNGHLFRLDDKILFFCVVVNSK